MNSALLTVLILTYNEEANLARTLDKLGWAARIVVLDSFSADGTAEIARRYPNVRFHQRKFDAFAAQWNHGLGLVETPWVLSLDADYVLTDELCEELKAMTPDSAIDAYAASFRYCVAGRPLRATLMPPRHILFQKEKCSYWDDGHTQRLRVAGPEARLDGLILHDDRKPLSRWLASQDRYAADEARKLRETPKEKLGLPDRLRLLKVVAPFAVLFYCLFVKGLVLDGWRGVHYSFQRMLAELWLSVRLLEGGSER